MLDPSLVAFVPALKLNLNNQSFLEMCIILLDFQQKTIMSVRSKFSIPRSFPQDK